MTLRTDKIDALFMRELSALIQEETRGNFVTVTQVKTAPDIRDAKVWISILDPKNEDLLFKIQALEGHFRHVLGRKLDLKYIPRFTFRLDRTGERAAKVEKILEEERKKGGL
jgi:ribosome-binding factor A